MGAPLVVHLVNREEPKVRARRATCVGCSKKDVYIGRSFLLESD